jgi:hypothetical protein
VNVDVAALALMVAATSAWAWGESEAMRAGRVDKRDGKGRGSGSRTDWRGGKSLRKSEEGRND